jgi:O-antigen biosynthesis protein
LIYVEGADSPARRQTMASIEDQIYHEYKYINDFSELGARSDSVFLIWLAAGDILEVFALYYFASSFNAHVDADLFYADDDESINGRRLNPFYKPDWSPDYLESFNYIGSTACFRASISALIASECSGIYDFILRFTERSQRVVHIRKILCQRGQPGYRNEFDTDLEIKALEKRLLRTGRRGDVSPIGQGISCYDIRLSRGSNPLVSIIIPTGGAIANINERRMDFVSNCVDSIMERSTYRNVEVIVVDDGELPDGRGERLRQRGCKLVTFSEPVFNFSKKVNLGATVAKGSLLLLLNDDVEPLRPDWLERMLEHFEKPHVGTVGAKLLYPDGTTQHVGVVLNSGNPDHVRRFRPRDDMGYFFSTCGARDFTAVTGACMMTRTNIYRQVGGYNEELPVNYNDVDYCLRVLEHDLTIVYAPQAELTHFESQTRVPRLDQYEIEYFAKKWAPRVITDRFYNESSLTVASPTFEIRQSSRRI